MRINLASLCLICVILLASCGNKEYVYDIDMNVEWSSYEDMADKADYIGVVKVESVTDTIMRDWGGFDFPFTTFEIETLYDIKGTLLDDSYIKYDGGEFEGVNYSLLSFENPTRNVDSEYIIQEGFVYLIVVFDSDSINLMVSYELIDLYDINLSYEDQDEMFEGLISKYELGEYYD